EGYIVSTDDRNLPITSFYQGDLKDLKIAYKPPAVDSDTERIFQIEFEVVDTEGAVSDPFAFMIVVKPMNTLAPVVTRNTGQLLYEGQSRPLSSSQSLQISDEDGLDKVKITVIDGLRHGELSVLGMRRKFFTPADLDAGLVIYQHDGSDTYSDNIIFRMTDGKNEVEFLFPITVVPTDDEPPIINANTGLVLFKNQMMPISSLMLSAADIDSEDSSIKFTIEPPFSTIGQVMLRQSEAPEDPSDWKFNTEDELYEKVISEWLQQDITDGKLFYKHIGPHSASTVMDQFVFRVQDDNDPPNQSGDSSFIIKILPVDDVAPELYPGTTLQMTVHEYQLTYLRKKFLRYTDLDSEDRDLRFTVIQPPTDTDENSPVGRDEDTDDLRLTFIVEDPPSLGEILVKGVPSGTFTQSDIINGFVVYAHTSGEIGLTTREDIFNLTLTDMSDEWTVGGNKITGVRVHVTILPLDSQAPEVFVGPIFTVVEGEKNVIQVIHISADDADTSNDDLLCTIIVQTTSGYVENISPSPGSEKSRSGTAISAFTIKDIRQNHIYYVQSIHKGVEPVEDRFTFRCSDGINFSERHFFPISIIPSNDEKPEIYMREFVVMEGMNIVIDTPILNGADADLPLDQLTFIITKTPKHGFILNQLTTGTIPVSNFTLDQIREASSIVYEHDDSESTEDSFDIVLTDGKFSVEKTIIVMIIPVDDETPRMAINDGLEIEIGDNEVDQGLIVYIHNGQEGIRDLIKFDVTDGINPLIDRYFYVTVGGIDMVFPDVISKGVSLKEGGRVSLTTDLLSTSDLNSPDEHLVFTITRAPMRGHLECTDTPGMPISSFTQLQLAGNKVYYIHTSDDEVKMDSFEFEVTDGYNPVFRTFRISITDVDNKKPVVTIHGLVVTEGENKLITPFELTVEDRDTFDHLLKFTVTQIPVHGRLLFNNTRPVTSFTKQDLNENRISYKHDGTESAEDSFSFTVTDGTHTDFFIFPDTVFETRKPQMMKITVLPVDNGVPQIVVNKGAPTLRVLETGHLGFVITSKTLRAEDRGSIQKSVTFRITIAPEHGYLINLGKGNATISIFTQAEINDMNICYVLRDGDNATNDIFYFSIEDSGGNKLKNQQYRLNWAWISLEKEHYVVDEEVKFLEVVLKRRGYLGETSFVMTYILEIVLDPTPTTTLVLLCQELTNQNMSAGIGTKDGTAEKDKDFRGKSQKQVQFNPGQITATWKVRILSDSEHEVSESFQIVLSEPVMAAIEFPLFATVEILDPDDESTVFIPSAEYNIEEDIGELLIPVHRSGDVSQELMVICCTQQVSATGTVPTTVLSYSDYISRPEDHHSILRFDKGEVEKSCRVVIIDDSLYEDEESFNVTLSMPMGGRLGSEFPAARITIIPDMEDALLLQKLPGGCLGLGAWPSTCPCQGEVYAEAPQEGFYPLSQAVGDVVLETYILATYLLPITFKVIPTNRLLHNKTTPIFYFGNTDYHVDESDGYVEVQVWRTGTDLSKGGTVTVRSRKTDPVSAEAGVDYVGISRNLDFAPGVTMQTFRVTVLDDLGQPVLEGPEKFELVLRMPMNGILGEPSKTTILINDSVSDLPKVQFRDAVYVCNENSGQISATVYRSGDISYKSTVRCYSRQGTAQVMMDFNERPNTDDSIITFLPGEIEKTCVLVLVDDTEHEEEKELRLVLGSPKSESPFGASIGSQNETLIKIKDDGDKAIIRFGETKFSVNEPKESGQVSVVRIPVLRVGDHSKVSVVRVHTKDGSATSGEDYNPISEEIVFKQGITEQYVEVEILYDIVREMREAFTVHLKPDENMVAETKMSKAIIYIEETNSMADVTFPSVPRVVSLLHYDDIDRSRDSSPVAGYPVICVTACNPKFPDYDKTGSICVSENINNTLTHYRWLVSAPTGSDGVTSSMREVDFDTFFTSSKLITLDSVYFQAGSRVQCAARGVNSNGDEGLELSSPIVSISMEDGMCQPRVAGTVGAEPFSAKLRYTGMEETDHPNLIKLTVTMPHIDGMLPVVSTRALSNFELTLSPDGTRVGNHRCSNLLDYTEVKTRYGFLSEATKNPEVIGETSSYQYSPSLRGSSTLRFYRNLNLEACLWEFTSYYDMSELLSDCGGTIGTDGQVLNLVQSYVTLRVPLYVSYVFHSPVGAGGWQHFDLQSEMKLTFVYDTAILWRDGIGSPPEAELQGGLYPTSMRINGQGRLVVNFRTEARFRGLFVFAHPASPLTSMVMCPDHPGITYNLSLVRNEPTYNQPIQQWTFVSDFAVRDYSGTYTLKLIPCTSPPNLEYNIPPVCNPREPLTFDMDIRFQQVSDPVAAEFSLNTQMILLSKRMLWLSDGSMGFGQESDTAFSQGDTIYGRVMVDPVQNLGDSFICNIEKVFLCTGADGYVPKYNPGNFEFGCLADAPSLLYRFKIIDKAQPETQARSFGNVAFNTFLAVDDPGALALVRQPGSDGFRIDSSALFQVSAGREWFIHTIYTVRSRNNANRGIGKRSLEYHVMSQQTSLLPKGQHRARRSANDVPDVIEDIGQSNNRGTNILHIALDRSSQKRTSPEREIFTKGIIPRELNQKDNSDDGLVLIIGVFVGLLLTVLIIIVVVLLVRSKRVKKDVPKKSSSAEPMMTQAISDSSEV
ncbi:hypothetical protein KUCAC02_006118, partial [Chaenocephalus aceratus]